MRLFLTSLLAVFSVAVVGCAPDYEPTARVDRSTNEPAAEAPADETVGDVGDEELEDTPITAANDDSPAATDDGSSTTPTAPTAPTTSVTATTTANVNLRKSASSSSQVLAVIPLGTTVKLLGATITSGFYNVEYNGQLGWAHSNYVMPEDAVIASVDVDGPASPANAIARAKLAIGFSYWWGGGAWPEGGLSSASPGSCSGTCPSCSHSGKYGADCSGLVAKAWQFGPKDLAVNAHPYSTSDFVEDVPGRWSTVSRSSMKPADALVYRASGSGHIVIYEKGDGWGTPTVYECKGCSYGCVYNARSFASGYKGIRRTGF